MSFKYKFFSAITLAFAIITFSTFVSAQDTTDTPPSLTREGKMGKRSGGGKMGKRFGEGRRGKHGRRSGHGMRGALRNIDLTEAQQAQIKSLVESHRANFAPQNEELRSLIQKKRDGSISETDMARLTEIHNQRKASSEQLKNTITGMLTPEQTAKIDQMKAERKQRREGRKERMMEKRQKFEKPSDQPKTDN